MFLVTRGVWLTCWVSDIAIALGGGGEHWEDEAAKGLEDCEAVAHDSEVEFDCSVWHYWLGLGWGAYDHMQTVASYQVKSALSRIFMSTCGLCPRVEEFTSQLLLRIGKTLGKPILANEICIHYSYDVMSALAFGEPMGYISGNSNDTAKSVLDNIQKEVEAIGLPHVPWLMGILTTDTTATALTFLLVNFALYPEWLQRLRDEVDPIFASSDFNCARALPVLDAIINESMRLSLSVFFGSQRDSTRGNENGRHFRSGGIIISIPSYQVGRGTHSFHTLLDRPT
ncbi:cytochrome P450 [Aspergillus californicus]